MHGTLLVGQRDNTVLIQLHVVLGDRGSREGGESDLQRDQHFFPTHKNGSNQVALLLEALAAAVQNALRRTCGQLGAAAGKGKDAVSIPLLDVPSSAKIVTPGEICTSSPRR